MMMNFSEQLVAVSRDASRKPNGRSRSAVMESMEDGDITKVHDESIPKRSAK
jgi:hypothetical protein